MNTKVVTFGEIMLRLAPPLNQRFSQAHVFEATYGGSEANVAVSLAKFGLNPEYITRLPQNDVGKSALMVLKMHGIGIDNIIWGGQRLGIYFVEKGAMNRPSKIIYDRQHSSFSEIQPASIDWNHVFEGSSWFHWSGITPAISQNAATVCKEALDIAAKKGLTVSCDLNFRNTLWKYGSHPSEVMNELLKACDFLISNEEDAEKYFEIKPKNNNILKGEINFASYESIGRQLCERFPRVKKVMFSLRASVNADDNTWSGVMWDGKSLIQSKVIRMPNIVDRIGGGDSFAAGLIYGFINYPTNNQRILDFAVAASSLKHSIHGDFNLSTVEEVLSVVDGDSSGRIQR